MDAFAVTVGGKVFVKTVVMVAQVVQVAHPETAGCFASPCVCSSQDGQPTRRTGMDAYAVAVGG